MTGWLMFAGYVAGFVYTARKASWTLMSHEESTYGSSASAAVENRIIGFLIGFFWPLVWLGVLVTGRLPKTPAALRRDIEERDQRIAQLERELGIGS